MTAATVAFLMPVRRFSSGVYSTVAAALIAMTDRSADWPCAHEPPPQLDQQSAIGICMCVGATCRSSKNDMRRLKIEGRSGFQCSFECCHYNSGCVGTDLVIYRCFWISMYYHGQSHQHVHWVGKYYAWIFASQLKCRASIWKPVRLLAWALQLPLSRP